MANSCTGGEIVRSNDDTGSVTSFSADRLAIPSSIHDPTAEIDYKSNPLDQYPPGQEPSELIIGQEIYLEPEGRFVLLFGGRLILGPNWPRLLVTLAALSVPFVLCAAFILPFAHPALSTVACVLWVLTMFFLLRCAMMDPGIVPKRVNPDDCAYSHTINMIRRRAVHQRFVVEDRFSREREKERLRKEEQLQQQQEQQHPQQFMQPSGHHQHSQWNGAPPNPETATIAPCASDHNLVQVVDSSHAAHGTTAAWRQEEKYRVVIRYCGTCRRYKGPRTHHCKQCDRCIDLFDHHCPWTGTCVGARNYASFLWFLHCLQGLLIVFVITVIHAPFTISEVEELDIIDALGKMYYMPIIIFIYMCFLGWSVTGLTLFHDYLVVHATTTFEHLRGAYLEPVVPVVDELNDGTFMPPHANPYDLGLAMNLLRFFGQYDPVVKSTNFDDKIVDIVREKRYDSWKRKQKNGR